MAIVSNLRQLAEQADRQGDWHRAIDLYRQLIAEAPDDGPAHAALGLVMLKQGQYATAAATFMRAVRITPEMPIAYFHLGICYAAQGQFAEAAAAQRHAILLDAGFAEAHYNLGMALHELGDFAAAAEAHRRAITVQPNMFQAYNGLAIALEAQDNLRDAIAHYRKALSIEPRYVTARLNLAGALELQGDWQQALEEYHQAVQSAPRDAHTQMRMARCLVKVDPNQPAARLNLAGALQSQGEYVEALAEYEQAARIARHDAMAHFQWGRCLQSYGQPEQAREQLLEAIRLDPQQADAHFLLGMIYLTEQDFARGWAEYEWRRKTSFAPAERPQPRWTGRDLAGAQILVHAEWGLGDTLHFLRYLPLVERRGGVVTLAVQPSLVSLLRDSGYQRVVSLDEVTGDFDWQVPLVSLPGVFGTTIEDIPGEFPYLAADPARIAQWRERLPRNGAFRVGIAWRGAQRGSPETRSIPLAAFKPLAAVPGVQLVSLQKHDETQQLLRLADDFDVHDLGDAFDADGAFVDSTAIIPQLDLVIACDSALAHVAGALGAPTWVVVSKIADWRWFESRDDSPWYPSLRLFRQANMGDWTEVFERVEAALARSIADANPG